MGKTRKGSTNDTHLEERKLQALDLRKSGASFRVIGQQLSISHETARTYVHEALRDLADKQMELAAEYRQLELERLDRLMLAVWGNATKGDVGSINAALKISDRRAKLLGLDAPTKQELTGKDGGAIEVTAIDYRHVAKGLAPEGD
jgi:DNA-binding CsgD family transcriptional regulator